jgi:alkanesulfonate monooxygenase SsuD/methylene tetrahydromethanopterin reductase-like flavin-dependent oxidoreductase (luciferase family)
MKASIICSNTYTEPAAWGRPSPVPRGVFDGAAGQRTLASALEQARLAEAVGFDFVSVSEHHFVPLMCTPNAAVWAGALSQVVTRATIAWLGPIASINNPVRVAEEIAMLDQLTGGRRLIVMPLRGTPGEHALYNNIDPADSRSITEEALLLIRRALTETEPLAWRGAHFDFPVVSVWPGRTTVPHPPLYSSGNSRDSVQFAARHRFPVAISFYDNARVAELTGEFREAAGAAGWAPGPDDILYRAWIALGESDAHADELRERFLPHGAARRAAPPPREIGTDADGKAHPGADRGSTGFGFGSVQFCGGPETVAGQLRAFHEATGAGIVDLSFGRGGQELTLAAIRRFGEQVLPRIRDIGARKAPAPA